MSRRETRARTLASELAEAFDRSFAEAPVPAGSAPEDYLTVRIGGDGYALRIAEIAGVFTDRRIVALPGGPPGLLGIVGIRGRMLPAYGLGSFLNHEADGPPRWLAVAACREAVALGFDRFETYVRITPDAVAAPTAASPAREYVSTAIRAVGGLRAVVDIRSIVEEIARRARTQVT